MARQNGKRFLVWGAVVALLLAAAAGTFFVLHAYHAVADSDIAQAVKARLFADASLHRYTIDVTAQNGIVTLAGEVNTDADRESAVHVADQQPGVHQVVNQLVLSGGNLSPQHPVADAGGQDTGGSPIASGPPADVSITTLVEVPGNRAWTAAGVSLNPGDAVTVSASGGVSFSRGSEPESPAGVLPDCLTAANGPYGWRASPFVANDLPCNSLLGRINENGTMFYIGAKASFRVSTAGQLYLGVNDNYFDDNSGSWTARVSVQRGASPASAPVSSNPIPTSLATNGGATMVQAILRNGETSIQLPPGRMYLYGMVTGGAAPSGPFAKGQFAEAEDAAGQVAAALAYGTDGQNSFETQTAYHVIGGASIGGPWQSFKAIYSSNSQSGASGASVNFTVETNSLVVFIGVASSQQQISLAGIHGLQTDSLSSGPSANEGMIIAHAYLAPGTYTAVSDSAALAAGQEPNHMADLIGVFVFGSEH